MSKSKVEHAFIPLRCGYFDHDENGKIVYRIGNKLLLNKDFNNIVRDMNPSWTDDQLKSINAFLNEEG